MSDDKVFNHITNRYMKATSRAAVLYMRKQEEMKKLQSPITNNIQDTEELPVDTPPIKKKLIQSSVNIVTEHKKKFKPELTQSQTDALLRKLLYEKLCIVEKKKSKPKSKTKPKYKIKAPTPPSSPSESESESEDPSDESD